MSLLVLVVLGACTDAMVNNFELIGVLERIEGWRSADGKRGGVDANIVDWIGELQCVETVPSATNNPWDSGDVRNPWRSLLDRIGDGKEPWRCTMDARPVGIGEAGILSGAPALIRTRSFDVLLQRTGELEIACCAIRVCNVATCAVPDPTWDLGDATAPNAELPVPIPCRACRSIGTSGEASFWDAHAARTSDCNRFKGAVIEPVGGSCFPCRT